MYHQYILAQKFDQHFFSLVKTILKVFIDSIVSMIKNMDGYSVF